MSVLFYDGQRSGPLSSDRFDWRGDSALDDGSDVSHDLAGGYYDGKIFIGIFHVRVIIRKILPFSR